MRNTTKKLFAFLIMMHVQISVPTYAAPLNGERSIVVSILASHPNGGSEMVSDVAMAVLADPAIAEQLASAYPQATSGQKFAIGAALKKAQLAAKSAGQADVAAEIAAAAKGGGQELSESVGGEEQAVSSLDATARAKETTQSGALHVGDAAVSPSRP
jgi:hypothetical protein